MNHNHSRISNKDNEQRGADHTRERKQQLRYSDLLTQKLAVRTQMDLPKRRGHLGYTATMLSLLRDPVSLGMKGGFRGSRR